MERHAILYSDGSINVLSDNRDSQHAWEVCDEENKCGAQAKVVLLTVTIIGDVERPEFDRR